ncbi:MAG TPA: hypothetical protein VGQ99_22285 [Tepidisphaeraceae bacterium]|jgi:hypothetical protein|nr:hypothetical protein [Tepidisphaeraceae bacterium]
MEATSSTFACAKCGKSHGWTPEIVGKTAKCSCGAVLKIPSAPPGTEAAKREIAYKEPNPGFLVPPAPLAGAASGEPLPTAEEAIISLYQPVTGSQPRVRAPMELADEELDPKVEAELNDLAKYGDKEGEQKKPNPYLDLHLPLILLGIGLMLTFGQASLMAGHEDGGLPGALFHVSVSLVGSIILMIIALLAAAKFTGIYFGNAATAILKIAAIYVAPTTLGSVLAAVLGGETPVVILGWGVSVVLYWALLAYLFRLDGTQTMACVFCIGLLRMITQMFIVASLIS